MTILSQDEMMKASPLSFRKWLFAEKLPLIVILVVWAVVLCVGLAAPGPMIGDEVTHYYMLKTQAERLPAPCFEAQIPIGPDGADKESRHYPHAFMWHYTGAVLFRLTGSAVVVQVYHSLFLLQLLLIVLALVKDLGGSARNTSLLALLVVASLPMTLIFSVAFYQDVPAIAQVATAFYFLLRKRWLLAAVFMALAISIKENMFLFLPAYFLVLAFETWDLGRRRWILTIVISVLVVVLSCCVVAWSLWNFAQGNYYPYEMLKITVNKIRLHFPSLQLAISPGGNAVSGTETPPQLMTSLYAPNVIANHPGDLRNPMNWLIYGGGVFWLLLVTGIYGFFMVGTKISEDGPAMRKRFNWLWFIGLSYLALAYMFLEAPEARFSLPGLIFLAIPLAGYAVRVRGVKFWIWVFIVAAFLQTGMVLHKTYLLRRVPEGIRQATEYLRKNPPIPNRVFMYPEGNYRFFPCPHDWYLNNNLREFWKGDNNRRLKFLRDFRIGAIVVKKHLVGGIDHEMNNLGIYPDYFVKDLDFDSRFRKVLENRDVIIYRLPEDGGEETPIP